jgi:hypothetical protein
MLLLLLQLLLQLRYGGGSRGGSAGGGSGGGGVACKGLLLTLCLLGAVYVSCIGVCGMLV